MSFIISVMIRLICCLTLILFLGTACDSTPEAIAELPTIAQLPTLTPSSTSAPTETAISTLPPTETPTSTITPTETPSVTPSATITDTPSPTPTDTPTVTPQPQALSLLAQLAAQATVLPPTYYPTPDIGGSVPTLPVTSCSSPASGGFGVIFTSDPSLAGQIGCPQGAVMTANSALQQFEYGTMIWVSGPIYGLYNDGRYQRFDDTFVAGVDPESSFLSPPPGLLEPIRGFGKIWRNYPDVRASIGWGTAPEVGGQVTSQRFDRGWMLDLTQRGDVLILIEDPTGITGTWRSAAGSY